MRAAMVGREALFHQVIDLLGPPSARVQLVGAPGIGTTRLAREVAAHHLGTVRWVELDGVEGGGLSEAVARAADVVPHPEDQGFVERLRHDVAPLLVLDGAQGVAEHLPGALRRWFGERGPRVLVTSRVRLALEGARVEVGPLDLDAARTLLNQRAGALVGSEALAADEVEALLAALDGVPLAVELAAGRLRLFQPEELANAPLLDALADARRAPRHSSMRHALRSSWGALSAPGQRALARLSTFTTPFGRRGYQAVAGEPLEVLEELLDASLVHREVDASGARHFRVLGPVRALASEQLADADAARRDRDAWLLEAARQAATRPDAANLARLSRLRPALVELSQTLPGRDERAAAAWALGVLTRAHGPLDLLPRACESQVLWMLSSPRREALASLLAEHLVRRGRLDEAARALDQADQGHPAVGLARAEVHFARGEISAARATLDALRLPAGPLHARSRVFSGALATREGRHAEAVAELRAVADDPQIDPESRGVALRYLALALRFVDGHHAEALAALRRAIEGHQQAGQRRLEALCYAILALELGDSDPGAALQATVAARARCVAVGERAFLHGIDQHEALIRLSIGEARQAEALLAAASREGANPSHLATYAFLDGLLHHVHDREAEAAACYQQCVASAVERDDQWHVDTVLPFLAACTGEAGALAGREGVLARVVRAALAAGVGPALRAEASQEVAGRLLLRLVAQAERPRVTPDGGRVRLPGGERVELGGRRVLRRMLATLLAADQPLGVPELLRRVWGPDVPLSRGRSRVHVALSHLRKRGLGPWLHTELTDDGPRYRLDAQPWEPPDGEVG